MRITFQRLGRYGIFYTPGYEIRLTRLLKMREMLTIKFFFSITDWFSLFFFYAKINIFNDSGSFDSDSFSGLGRRSSNSVTFFCRNRNSDSVNIFGRIWKSDLPFLDRIGILSSLAAGQVRIFLQSFFLKLI